MHGRVRRLLLLGLSTTYSRLLRCSTASYRSLTIGYAWARQMGLLPAVIYPICIFETIDKLGPFSLLGVAAVVYTAVVICYHGFADPFRHGLTPSPRVDAEAPRAFNINLASLQAVNIICL